MNIRTHLDKIRDEQERNHRFLHLTPNEPYMSQTAGTFMNSPLAQRYYLGAGENDMVDENPFTALGFPGIAQLVAAAENATKQMLGATVVNLSCLSGVHAMMCAILSTTEPGDTVMTIHHDHGGHFATKGIIDRIGRKHIFTKYNQSEMKFDAKAIAQSFHQAKAKVFYMDASYYINPHNLRDIREALGDEAIIIYDASHTMGLIMGEQFQNPLAEGADIICANTHKTLPGPQKGMIAFRDEKLGNEANATINSCLYSSPHTATLIALSITILEMKEYGKAYAQQIISNSNTLGEALESAGFQVRRANTGRISENHQVHLFTEEVGEYRRLYKQLYNNSITVAFDDGAILGGGMFIRLGTQEITRRGMKEDEMRKIAGFLKDSLTGLTSTKKVEAFNDQYRHAHYSFDTS